jgi:branched-subunit amino acid transport protein
MALVTYIPRVLPMLIHSKHYPLWLKDSLEFLPVAIISAVVMPDIISKGYGNLFIDAEFITTILVIIIAIISRNLIITVVLALIILYLNNLFL